MQDLIKKMKFKGDGVIINAPAAIGKAFVQLGFSVGFDKKKKSTNTLVFVGNNKELLNFLNKELKNVEEDSVLWFAYPKGSSKIQTDINRDTIRLTGEEFGITTVTAVSIDDVWSGLRFRPIDRVGK